MIEAERGDEITSMTAKEEIVGLRDGVAMAAKETEMGNEVESLNRGRWQCYLVGLEARNLWPSRGYGGTG